MRRSSILFVLASLALSACAQIQQQPQPQPIVKQPDLGTGPFLIGTGSTAGVYHALGQEICRSYEKAYVVEASSCDILVQRWSEAKLKSLQSQILDMAIVHSDWARSATNGTGPFTNSGPMNRLRSVASFYSQPLSVIVKRNSGITELDELPEARLVAASNSSADVMFQIVLRSKGWTEESFASLVKVDSTRAALDAFCEGSADAMLVNAGHPSGFVQKATTECGGRLLPVEIPGIAEEIADNPALAEASIPAGMYRGQSDSIPTFGYRAVLVARSDTPDVVVAAVVNAVLNDFDAFKRRHPAFAELEPGEMAIAGLAAPLHPAAEAAYRLKGLVP
ncbi:TAXI family TRAP transporter solute-binding subunit [Pelagibius sp. Alg239-R121]|uniref:TAXI family TRAP transporter solute-binding subunit n=1 Tax=Pelagibius sp. Alg239-R121 TaxID=2993448 RepID=UPI0024A73548|nr:TAXI family TRAP transporter solute-binding subunit [Pelagibius sp. Alg239-R121]